MILAESRKQENVQLTSNISDLTGENGELQAKLALLKSEADSYLQAQIEITNAKKALEANLEELRETLRSNDRLDFSPFVDFYFHRHKYVCSDFEERDFIKS